MLSYQQKLFLGLKNDNIIGLNKFHENTDTKNSPGR